MQTRNPDQKLSQAIISQSFNNTFALQNKIPDSGLIIQSSQHKQPPKVSNFGA